MRWLFAPIDIAAIVYYRVAFGALALWEVWRFADAGWIERHYIEPGFHFSYYGFAWLQPWSGDGIYWHFAALALLSVCIIVGFCYRAAAALFFLGFVYVFLLERANYLNHLYLFSLIAFLMIFVPAHRDLSVDARLRPGIRSETAPAWSLALLRLQMGVAYFFAGVAKMNADWLHGWPLRLWLPSEQDFPVIGGFFTELWCQLLFSYGGLLLDTLAPFLLLWRRTRGVTFLITLAFHLTNARLFGIGIFPWLSIATTLLFFPPDWPRRVFNYPRRGAAPDWTPPRQLRRGQSLAATAIGAWVAFQLLFPLRHFAYPGNVSWTEEGHDFAWHQKLRDKQCDADFTVFDRATGDRWEIRWRRYLTGRQQRKMSGRPHMLLEFAHFLAREFSNEGTRSVEVTVRAGCELNGRPWQLLVDPEVDLAREPRDPRPKRWILPLETPHRGPAGEVRFNPLRGSPGHDAFVLGTRIFTQL